MGEQYDFFGYDYNSNTNFISTREVIDEKLSSMKEEMDTSAKEINKVLDGAPETLDTLKEVADKFDSLDIDDKVNRDEVYTRDEADATFLKSASLDTYATKEYVDSQDAALSSTIATKADADSVYSKTDADATFLKSASLDSYATKKYVDGQDATLSSTIAAKADADSVYSKTDADAKFLTDQSLDGYATIEAMENAMATKADADAVYGKDDVYTKGETDEIVAAGDEVLNGQISQLLTRIENLEQVNSVAVVDDTIANVPAGSNVVVTSAEAVQSMTGNTEFNTITIVGGNTNKDVKAIASDKVTIDGMTVNGEKGASNGRMQLSANTVTLKNITVESGSTAYNVFESSQNTSKSEYFTKEFNASGLNVDNTLLNHNVVNIYTFADNAVVNFKDSNFNLDADNSNPLRLANYTNATGVTVNFENVNWTYENATASSWEWAGLVIYQPAMSDAALNGDYSKIATWKFNFKNCKYNDEVVNSVNFGNHNQVIYGYNLNKSGGVCDLTQEVTGITITFE